MLSLEDCSLLDCYRSEAEEDFIQQSVVKNGGIAFDGII